MPHISREFAHVLWAYSIPIGLALLAAVSIGVYVLFYFKVCDDPSITWNGPCSYCGGDQDVINGECRHCHKANHTACWPGDVIQ